MSNIDIPSPFIKQCYFQNFNSTTFGILLSLLALRDFKNPNTSFNLSDISTDPSALSSRDCFIIAAYSAIILVSLFGNCMVLNVVIGNSRLRSATYVFFTNLALSDLLMTILNIPFNAAQMILSDWPFGSLMCSLVPFAQATSVYVSTFSMTYIAYDRYRVICKPLKPKLEISQALKVTVCIWLLAISLSLPYAIYNTVIPVFTFKVVIRCQTVFPETYSRWTELLSLLMQYVIPLMVTGTLCSRITLHIWRRNKFDGFTREQAIIQEKAKRRAIKMIMAVVILFAICWLPLNTFHMLKEFTGIEFMCKSSNSTDIHSTFYFFCHWLAMSSVCYNPFVYCWLNEHFRKKIMKCPSCFRCSTGLKLRSLTGHQDQTFEVGKMEIHELNQYSEIMRCLKAKSFPTEKASNSAVMNAYESTQVIVSSTLRSSIEVCVRR